MIREAGIDDAPLLARLCSQFGYTVSASSVLESVDRIIHDREQVILVSTGAQRITGWVHVFISDRIESGRFAEIGGLVVDQDCRSQGIGRSLVEHAGRWAIGQGMSRLRVRCAEQRTVAHAFYQRLGMTCTKSQQVLDLQLPGEETAQ